MQADLKLSVTAITGAAPRSETPMTGTATMSGNDSAAGGKALPARDAAVAASVDPEQLNGVIKQLTDYVQKVQRQLEFSLDEESGRTIIRVIDSATEEVIRQIPPEELLAIARHLDSGSVSFVEAEA